MSGRSTPTRGSALEARLWRVSNKKPEPFNNPFSKVKLAAEPEAAPGKPAPARGNPGVKATSTPAPRGPPAKVVAAPKKADLVDADAALFLAAIGEVATVRAGKQKVGPPPPRSVDQLAVRTEEAESLVRLAELVSSGGEFSYGESSEGWVRGLDPNVLRRLRAGEFAPEAQLDLHGLTREAAKPSLDRFISRARVAGHRCVLVVTGQGLHSENQVPVIKHGVQEWLTHGGSARQVLAFCAAKPKDGGAGALYVLVRR